MMSLEDHTSYTANTTTGKSEAISSPKKNHSQRWKDKSKAFGVRPGKYRNPTKYKQLSKVNWSKQKKYKKASVSEQHSQQISCVNQHKWKSLRDNSNSDPYPGKKPIPEDKKRYYSYGKGGTGEHVRTKHKKLQFVKHEKKVEAQEELMARAELLLTEQSGFLEPEPGEKTTDVTQHDLIDIVDITSATKFFSLDLQEYGPYRLDYTHNGRFLALGGHKGHVAAIDWVTKNLLCEINVMEEVYDINWLHNESFFAVAQKDWVYVYDSQGVEVHCLRQLKNTLRLEFLPYHFLLVAATENSKLNWIDVSTGTSVAHTYVKQGRLDVICQNPYNAVVCLGHSKGTVSMWTPNMKEPVAKVLCHKHPIRAITVDNSGRYMVTTGVDRSLKIWDVRKFNCIQNYHIGSGVSGLSFSQRELLAVSMGNIVEVYKGCCQQTVDGPYMRHRMGKSISGIQFCPYEDVLGIGHSGGFTSILIPGAGEPNFDAFESNPFATRTQKREGEVKSLLEKIPAELITLDPELVTTVNVPMLKQKTEERNKLEYLPMKKIDFTPRKKSQSSVIKAKNKHLLQEKHKRQILRQKKEEEKRKDIEIPEKEADVEEKVVDVLSRFKKKKR